MEGHSEDPQANLLLKERLLTEPLAQRLLAQRLLAQSLMPMRFVTPSLTAVPAYMNAFISSHIGRAGGGSPVRRDYFLTFLVLEIVIEL